MEKQDLLRDQRRSQHSPVGRGGSLKGSQLAGRTIIDEGGLDGGRAPQWCFRQENGMDMPWIAWFIQQPCRTGVGVGGCRLGPVPGL